MAQVQNMAAAILVNTSPDIPILISLTKVENITEPLPNENIVSPGSKVQRKVEGGVMNMFVWSSPDKKLIWKGIVPTKITKEIMIYPEKKEVSFDGVAIPKDFLPVTNFDSSGMKVSGSTPSKNWKIGIMVLICIVLFFLLYYYFQT